MRSGKQGLDGSVLLLVACVGMGAGEAMAIEEPDYTVIEQAEDFELRQYEPYIVAETLVEATGCQGKAQT